MAELKTKKNNASVPEFLKKIKDPARLKDCKAISKMMADATGKRAKMWGTSLIGFGEHQLTYASGREVEWFSVAYSPRKTDISIYLTCDIQTFKADLKKLGKHKHGKGCLYIKALEDVNVKVLQKMIVSAVKASKKSWKG